MALWPALWCVCGHWRLGLTDHGSKVFHRTFALGLLCWSFPPTVLGVFKKCANANTFALVKTFPVGLYVFCAGKLLASHGPLHPWAKTSFSEFGMQRLTQFNPLVIVTVWADVVQSLDGTIKIAVFKS